MINATETKAQLRKQALEKRVSMASCGLVEIDSKKIVNRILSSLDFKKAKNIALYYPIKNEPNLLGLLDVKDKNFYFPKCDSNKMEFCEAKSVLDFTLGMYNIKEPKGKKIDPKKLDIIYIPALMANRKNYRLGYGKGYYDRFFSENKIKAKKIIVLQSAFVSDDFCEDNNDYKCDSILSEFLS